MKKFAAFMVIAALLLAGCAAQAPVPVETPPAESPDIEAIVRQSVDEAIAQYEEEQKAKDAEIEELRAQLEAVFSQMEEEAPPPEESSAEDPPSVSASSQPSEPKSFEPEQLDSEPEEPVRSQSSTPSSPYDGFDLKNLYPSYVWENYQPSGEDDGSSESEYKETENSFGTLLEDDAIEAIRLANLEREAHDLAPLPVDEELMELAEIRAVEIRELYSHTRPDGTSVVDLRCGENCGRKTSPEAQVNSWMNSEGHRTNILLDRYHHIGAACYLAENGNHYWVMVFSLD